MTRTDEHRAVGSHAIFVHFRNSRILLAIVMSLLACAGAGVPSAMAFGIETGACCDHLAAVCLEGLTREECEADEFDERSFGGVGSTCSTIQPPCESCEDVCESCTVKEGEGTRRAVLSLVDVEPIGSQTRFTYHLCQGRFSQNMSHWILGMSPECCSRITASDGGSYSGLECAIDPTTGLFGLKFVTEGGVGTCGTDECSEGGDLFSVQLAGVVGTACVKAVKKINGAPASAFGCVQGPSCEPCKTDADCDNSDPCSRTETCNELGHCVPRTEVRDCNGNAVEDLCDIVTGWSRDCGGNLVPDECEAEDCTGEPACDDCNLNGVPDGCDIDSGLWPDVDPVDGIPDACVDPLTTSGDWTSDIWDLSDEDPKHPYPDNQDGVTDLHVTIDGSTIFLDDSVEIQTLRLLNGGTLLVTQCGSGDLGTVAAGGVLNEGNLLVANDRQINIGGADITIGPGGRFASTTSPCASGCPAGVSTCASLTAGDLTLKPGDCNSFRSGAAVELDQSMSIDLSGNLVLEGNPFFGCAQGRSVQPRGINVSPKLQITPGSTATFENLELSGFVASTVAATNASVASGGNGSAAGPSTPGVRLRRHFVNHSIAPSLFDWATGYLALVGDEQVFEVAGMDLGPTVEGFSTSRDTLFDFGSHSNFSIGTVEVLGSSHVTFVNDFASTVGEGACEEALYVRHLTLHAGATLTLDNVRVYYETMEDAGAVVETVGCGALLGLCNAQVPSTDFEAKNRFITITTGIPGRLQAIRVLLEDLPVPFDVLNGQVMWVGAPANINEAATLITPEPGSPSFWAAKLRCTPQFLDWSAFGSVHVYHRAVIPGGTYPIQIIDESCEAGVEAGFSAPLNMQAALFGDVVGGCLGTYCTGPDGLINISDLLAVINTFASVPGAVSKVRADMEPALPDFLINISDALVGVDAFSGVPFPFAPPVNPCGD